MIEILRSSQPPSTGRDAVPPAVQREEAGAWYIGLYENNEKIRSEALEEMGLRFTGRYLAVNNQYKLFELLPEESSLASKVSFLSTGRGRSGVIVPYPFHEHQAKLRQGREQVIMPPLKV